MVKKAADPCTICLQENRIGSKGQLVTERERGQKFNFIHKDQPAKRGDQSRKSYLLH